MQLGNYRLITRLGVGGMGEVWRAEDQKLLRHVAIKILPAQLAADPEWKDRFVREARTVAQLNHPNIATLFAIEEDGDTLFLAMELVEGDALAKIIARGPLPVAEAVRIAAYVCDALGEAHSKGIVHRDIKPENILVSPRVVKVLDFGIAKQIGGKADPALTQGGMVVGTPHYMSPEQAFGKPVDTRTDIFSLGVVMHEMLSGRKPFEGDAVTQILLQIVSNEPPDLGKTSGVSSQLADVVKRCMSKKPEDRFRTCDEVRKALLQAFRDDRSKGKATATQESEPHPGLRSMRTAEPPPRNFVSKLPEPQPERPRIAQPEASTVRKPAPQRPRRALVADDDPAARYLLGSILDRYKIAYDEAENGADAVKCLKKHEYSLVFLDLLMPRVDGWGVLDFLRNRRSEVQPQLFLVTGVQDQKLSTADQDLVSGMIFKPIDVQQIEQLVR